MSFESTAIGILHANAALIALVPVARIKFSEAPQGVENPFVVCSRVATDPQNTLDEGTAGTRAQLDNITLQVSCYAPKLVDALAIAAAVRKALTNEATLRALCIGEDPAPRDGTNLHGQVLEFSCWYAEDIA